MADAAALVEFACRCPRLFVLTGAGVSTASGIPGYRDAHGRWQRQRPVTHQAFIADEAVRRRYWARSQLGWPLFAAARPNRAHAALARLERDGRVERLVTQNVDGLHQRAGSAQVIDLHGRLDEVVCLACAARMPRAKMQALLGAANPGFGAAARIAPDGDADMEADCAAFAVPACPRCGGVLKPDVVFFGGSVPRPRVDEASAALGRADGVLVVGTSLMAWSGYRFCVAAHEAGKPIAAVNAGCTRADALLALKVERDCGDALEGLDAALAR